MDKIYRCVISCTFRVKENLEPKEAPHNQAIVGFTMPDGRVIRPIVAMEVESKGGNQYRDVTSQNEMGKLGLEDLDYDDVTGFEEEERASEQLENEEYDMMPLENIPANLEPRFDSTRSIIERRLRDGK